MCRKRRSGEGGEGGAILFFDNVVFFVGSLHFFFSIQPSFLWCRGLIQHSRCSAISIVILFCLFLLTLLLLLCLFWTFVHFLDDAFWSLFLLFYCALDAVLFIVPPSVASTVHLGDVLQTGSTLVCISGRASPGVRPRRRAPRPGDVLLKGLRPLDPGTPLPPLCCACFAYVGGKHVHTSAPWYGSYCLS